LRYAVGHAALSETGALAFILSRRAMRERELLPEGSLGRHEPSSRK
jgi:hypothetical protein